MKKHAGAMRRLAARLEKRSFDVGQFAGDTGQAGLMGAVQGALPGVLLGGYSGGWRGAAHGGIVGGVVGAVPSLITGALQAYQRQNALDEYRKKRS